ncbi:hypothetical protein DH2020_008832 [Rehmannia glutinosa]|uniref:Uncharacterized protein n=1 Tax=Rehmannia glutinosa TaxID=99300 RepID=A0ABR0X565_REHGL
MPSNLIIGSSSGSSEEVPRLRAHYNDQWENFTGGGASEIEEEMSGEVFDMNNDDGFKIPLETIREEVEGRLSTSSFNFGERSEDVVYVAVGKQGDETSMDAQVNPGQKELYMAQERGKRRDFLQKFLNVCSSSQVKADTILIESEMEAKAILDLIPILNIRKLVLGATKSTIRYNISFALYNHLFNFKRMRSRKLGNGVADQIVQGAPEFCEVKIICEGKEISEMMMESPSVSSSHRSTADSTPKFVQEQEQTGIDSAACGCFKI